MTIGHWPINQPFSKFTLGFGSGFPRLIHGLEKKLRRVCNLDCLITHKIRIFCIYKLAFSDFCHLIHFCDSQFSIIKWCFVIIPFSFSLNKDKEMSSETAVFNETLPFPSFHLKMYLFFSPKEWRWSRLRLSSQANRWRGNQSNLENPSNLNNSTDDNDCQDEDDDDLKGTFASSHTNLPNWTHLSKEA